jgi:hypothetical protein
MKKIGIALVLIGLALLAKSLLMETAVLTKDLRYVHNIGLLQQQSNFILISCVIIVIGVIAFLFSISSKKESSNAAQAAGTQVKDSIDLQAMGEGRNDLQAFIDLQTVGEGRNDRQALKDDDCFINGYFEKFMMNGYECFDLDNGKAMVLTPKRKLVYINLNALKKAMEEQSKTGTFTGALIEIYL